MGREGAWLVRTQPLASPPLPYAMNKILTSLLAIALSVGVCNDLLGHCVRRGRAVQPRPPVSRGVPPRNPQPRIAPPPQRVNQAPVGEVGRAPEVKTKNVRVNPRLTKILKASVELAMAFGATEEEVVAGLQQDFDQLWEDKLGKHFSGYLGRQVRERLREEIAEEVHDLLNTPD